MQGIILESLKGILLLLMNFEHNPAIYIEGGVTQLPTSLRLYLIQFNTKTSNNTHASARAEMSEFIHLNSYVISKWTAIFTNLYLLNTNALRPMNPFQVISSVKLCSNPLCIIKYSAIVLSTLSIVSSQKIVTDFRRISVRSRTYDTREVIVLLYFLFLKLDDF